LAKTQQPASNVDYNVDFGVGHGVSWLETLPARGEEAKPIRRVIAKGVERSGRVEIKQ
jgi:hypothetical protein